MSRPIDPGARLSVRGIKKAFGTNVVLKGIDIDVQPGSVVALIGGNGAGKSTLVKIIMGIYTADSGEVCMAGVPCRLSSWCPDGSEPHRRSWACRLPLPISAHFPPSAR